jgi:hypothetical protein
MAALDPAGKKLVRVQELSAPFMKALLAEDAEPGGKWTRIRAKADSIPKERGQGFE